MRRAAVMIRRKRLFVPALIVLLALCAAIVFLPKNRITGSFLPMTGSSVRTARYAYASEDGRIYVVDDSLHRLLCLKDGKALYAVSKLPFSGSSFFIHGAEIAPDGGVYIHFVVNYVESYTTQYESICLYDSGGRFVREVFRQSYEGSEDPPHRNPRLKGLGLCGEDLRFAYVTDESVTFYELSGDNDTVTNVGEISGGVREYLSIQFLSNGSYVYSKRTGEVGWGMPGAAKRDYYRFQYSILNGGTLPYYVDGEEETVYVMDGSSCNVLSVTSDGAVSTIVGEEDFDALGLSSIDHISMRSGTLAGVGDGRIWVSDAAGPRVLQDGFSVPFLSVIPQLLRICCIPAAIFLVLVLLLYVYRYIMGRRISLFIKQLALIIPAILGMIGISMGYMNSSVSRLLINDMMQRTMLYCATTASEFNGDDIAAFTGLRAIASQKFKSMLQTQDDILRDNADEWNKPFYNALYLVQGDTMYLLSISNNSSPNFSYYDTISEDDPEWAAYYEGEAFVDLYSDMEGDWVYAQVPICDSQGNRVALYEVGADLNNFNTEVRTLLSQVLARFMLFCPIIIACVILVTYLMVKGLRNTGKIVEKISDGDFNVRIEHTSRDEIGDIGSGVNKLAEHLLASFSRTHELSDIYFKYVPIQFMDLLGKEDITAVRLGDARSVDITTLFFDIRQFSLNSEMMTAKESFAFINRISGVAGPIIRRYNGFVDKYIGDAVMALFTDAYSAVAAGVELYQSLVVNDETNIKVGDDPINIGIGVHSGMSMLGIIGESERLSSTVISENVNLSSRLESLTKQYNAGMIITKDTLDRMGEKNQFRMRFLGMIQVAGVNEVVALFEVLDCLEDARRLARLETKELFESGVRKFHLGHLPASLECFRQVAEKDPTDKVVKTYMEYIQKKIDTGNTNSNYFRFTNK